MAGTQLKGIKSRQVTTRDKMNTVIATPEQATPKVGKRGRVAKVNPVVAAASVGVPVVETPPPVVEEPVAEPVSEAASEEDVSVEKQIDALRETLNANVKEITEKLKVFKTVEHELKKLAVLAKKEFKKKAKKSGTKKTSNHGFNALVKISNELADFLNLPHGSVIRPPQVSSLISKYAIERGLKEEGNKAVYKCDAKMKKLLGAPIYPVKKSEPALGMGVSIFNLNSYLKPHFTKIEVAPEVVATA